MDSIGISYEFQVTYQGALYRAASILNPVPPIDSIKYEFEEVTFGDGEDGYQAEFFATDIAGREDFYWVKGFKNNAKIGDVNSFFTSENGAFGGTNADGLLFVFPVRVFAINDGDERYQLGDNIRVELWSINEEIAEFFSAVETQTNNGGLFSTPPSNVKSNIRNANGLSQNEVLGAFCISSITTFTDTVN